MIKHIFLFALVCSMAVYSTKAFEDDLGGMNLSDLALSTEESSSDMALASQLENLSKEPPKPDNSAIILRLRRLLEDARRKQRLDATKLKRQQAHNKRAYSKLEVAWRKKAKENKAKYAMLVRKWRAGHRAVRRRMKLIKSLNRKAHNAEIRRRMAMRIFVKATARLNKHAKWHKKLARFMSKTNLHSLYLLGKQASMIVQQHAANMANSSANIHRANAQWRIIRKQQKQDARAVAAMNRFRRREDLKRAAASAKIAYFVKRKAVAQESYDKSVGRQRALKTAVVLANRKAYYTRRAAKVANKSASRQYSSARWYQKNWKTQKGNLVKAHKRYVTAQKRLRRIMKIQSNKRTAKDLARIVYLQNRVEYRRREYDGKMRKVATLRNKQLKWQSKTKAVYAIALQKVERLRETMRIVKEGTAGVKAATAVMNTRAAEFRKVTKEVKRRVAVMKAAERKRRVWFRAQMRRLRENHKSERNTEPR